MREAHHGPNLGFRYLSISIATLLGLVFATAQARAQAQSIPTSEVPFYSQWAASPHANQKAEAFHHWDKEGKVPVECARCHSTPGFLDYLGADGSAAGKVDQPAPTGTVLTCIACHNTKTLTLATVTFPSGVRVDNLGPDARCMTCHQGVESAASVDKAVEGLKADEVGPKLGFINVHYRAAGAMLLGGQTKAAYQYQGKSYRNASTHPAPYNHCLGCHTPHSTEVKATECANCHTQVKSAADLKLIRFSKPDYDGNGNATEGISQEVAHLEATLLTAIQAYAKQVGGKPIVYDIDTYPYFFTDTNGNGKVDSGEAAFPNRYAAWTPRLLKAAYNYQFAIKDPGAYAHNPAYVIEILEDSINDLGTQVKLDAKGMVRP